MTVEINHSTKEKAMADLFSSEWMQAFGQQWNQEPECGTSVRE